MRAAIALALTLFAAPTQARRRLEREAWNDDADAVVSCGACCLKVEPNDGTLDAWYASVVDLAGFKVAASSEVRDAALLEAAYTVARMARDRPDLVATLVAEGVHMAVIGEDEVLTDIPGYASLGASWDWTRGVGATRWIPITSCAEENLLCLSDDVYSLENICLHETAHTLQGSGGKLPTTRLTAVADGEDLDAVLRALYQEKVVEQDLFPNTYANDNHEEYWAEGVQAYYDLNTEGPEGGDGVHNHIDTRAELAVYDPELFNVIDGILADVDMSCPATVACDCADAEVVSICAAFDLTTCSADWGSCAYPVPRRHCHGHAYVCVQVRRPARVATRASSASSRTNFFPSAARAATSRTGRALRPRSRRRPRPRLSLRRSPRLSLRRSPRLSPRRSPRLSLRRSPRLSLRRSPRLSPRPRRRPRRRRPRRRSPRTARPTSTAATPATTLVAPALRCFAWSTKRRAA